VRHVRSVPRNGQLGLLTLAYIVIESVTYRNIGFFEEQFLTEVHHRPEAGHQPSITCLAEIPWVSVRMFLKRAAQRCKPTTVARAASLSPPMK
jgi:hypothetical protein